MPHDGAIVIGGPTASGKSRLAMDIALRLNGAVVNADSMQIYRNLPILSASPSSSDLAEVEHVLYGIKDISEESSVADWLELAVGEIGRIWKEGKIPVVVGGTGLYIDNLINGTTPIPETKPEIKSRVSEMLRKEGVNKLHQKLKEVDAESYGRLSENDTTRVRRAWEVYLDTGKPISEWHKAFLKKVLPKAKFVTVKLMPPIEVLEENINRRFDKMVEAGVLDEVREALKRNTGNKMPGMKTLGLPEIIGYLEGKSSLEEAAALAKLHSRQYAKRQKTWFKNKMKADIEIDECYFGQESVLKSILAIAQSEL